MNDDVVNIHLAVPKPIRFEMGEHSFKISGALSMRQGLAARQILKELDDTSSAMDLAVAAAGGVLTRLQAEEITIEEAQALNRAAEAAVIAYEEKGDEVIEYVKSLIRSYDPKQAIPELDMNAAQQIAATAWRRAMGATDEQLATPEEGADPPTPNRAQRRSTSRNGSTSSVKPTVARPRNGSRNRS